MSDLKAVIEVKSLAARCPLDPCFIKLILKQSQFDQPVDCAKLESKKQLVLRNGRVDINENFELPVEASFLRDNKITVIVMASKGKQISLLGVANIDFKKINSTQNQTMLELPLEKCADTKAELNACVRFSDTRTQSQQTFDFDRNGLTISQPPATYRSTPSTVTVPSFMNLDTGNNMKKQVDPSEGTMVSSRMRAIQISRRNFKHVQIQREDKKSTSRDTSGSYKKRFQYQQKIDSNIPSQGRTNIIKMFGRKKHSQRQPMARDKTPQPIKFQSINSKHSPPKNRIKQGSFSNAYESKPKKQQIRQSPCRRNTEPTPQEQRSNRVRFVPSIDTGHIVSNRSRSNSRDRYANLAEKLEQIQQQIQREKTSIDTHNNSKMQMDMILSPTSVCTFGETEQWKTTSCNPKQFETSFKTSADMTRQFQKQRSQMEQIINTQSRRVKDLQDEKAQNELLIEKLTKLYEDCQDKLLQQNSQNQQIRASQIESYKNQISRLNQELQKVNKENEQLRTQLANKKTSDIETQLKSEKRKVINLSSEIKFKENELRFAKLSEQALKAEKKQLEQEVRKLQVKQPMGRKESKAELNSQIMNSVYPSTLRAENKLLKDQIELLQKHNAELNGIIEQKERLVSNSKCTEHEQTIKDKSTEIRNLKQVNRLLEQKYNLLSEKSKSIEEDLIKTKNNFAEAMNVAFEKGGSQLVDLLESRMTFREDRQ